MLNFQSSNYAGKLAYILLYVYTKVFMQQIKILISGFFYVPISSTFCGQYIWNFVPVVQAIWLKDISTKTNHKCSPLSLQLK